MSTEISRIRHDHSYQQKHKMENNYRLTVLHDEIKNLKSEAKRKKQPIKD